MAPTASRYWTSPVAALLLSAAVRMAHGAAAGAAADVASAAGAGADAALAVAGEAGSCAVAAGARRPRPAALLAPGSAAVQTALVEDGSGASVQMLQQWRLPLGRPGSARSAEATGRASSAPPGLRRLLPSPELARVLPIAWAHFPKCGSSFLNTLIHAPGVCPLLSDNLVVDRRHFGRLFLQGFHAAYDVQASCPGLMETYFGHNGIEGLFDAGKGHFMTMLRQPEQRLIAAYNDMADAFARDGPQAIRIKGFSWGGWPTTELPALVDFVRWNAGCVVRMLTRTGLPCGGWDGPPTRREVDEAKLRLKTGFVFVGMTDQWDLSMCLFSAMFKVPCRADQFADSRPGTDKKAGVEGYPEELLGGLTDPYDRELYMEAVRLFEASLARYNVSEATCQPCYRQAGMHQDQQNQ